MFRILLCYSAFNRFLDSSKIVHVSQMYKRVDRLNELYSLNLIVKLISLLLQIISNLTIMDMDVAILIDFLFLLLALSVSLTIRYLNDLTCSSFYIHFIVKLLLLTFFGSVSVTKIILFS